MNTVLQLPLRHFWCSQGFPPTNQRWHERNRSLTCNILRSQEEHRRACLLRPSSTLLHLLQELHNFSSCFFCQVQGTLGWKPSHPTSVFALYTLETFSNSSRFLSSSFFQGLSSKFCTSPSHCQCFTHSFLFASQRSTNLEPLFLFRICAPPLHAVSLGTLGKSPALPSAVLNI